jgi:hypothetical protein
MRKGFSPDRHEEHWPFYDQRIFNTLLALPRQMTRQRVGRGVGWQGAEYPSGSFGADFVR